MSAFFLASVVFCGAFFAALAGMLLRVALPGAHLDADSRDVIKLVLGLIGTMSALILGLLIASANSNYNEQSSELQSISAKIILLDRILTYYGPESEGARKQLGEAVAAAHDRIWSPQGLRPTNLEAANRFMQQLQALSPKTDMARQLQGRALQIAENILQTRLLMASQAGGAIPAPFLAILVFWICVLFLGFGMFTRFNGTVAAALFVGAFSVAGAIFLILELNTPYQGFMQISDAPLRAVLSQIGR
ncbi:MAG TPA: hypothetical protein VK446_12290 [Methylocystis sp.]|nr:hypothetical protein [Methylocystis sp.]